MENSKSAEVQKIFQMMPAKFRRGKTTKNVVYHLDIEGTPWTVRLSSEHCTVEEGVLAGQADCYLKTSAEIFLGTIKGTFTPTIMDLMNGRIKVTRPELLLAFKEVFGDVF